MSSGAIPINRYIDHTCLKPDAIGKTIESLCLEAIHYGFYSVCVNSFWVPRCSEVLAGTGVKICAVGGFPLGANLSGVKAFEAVKAAEAGAAEIDMVMNVGLMLEGDFDGVKRDIAEVVRAVKGQADVKVILETGLLNDEQKRIACRLAAEAGAAFVKTSTGFGPEGATVEDVRLMRSEVPDNVAVKASGGIRDLSAALRMIEAGASRLGTSSGIAIVKGMEGTGRY
ncbi:deoxyribose-phosphate aldolase [Ferviditalea candida]|uniref:Deoxyribose-phosphate aldolase n=1 Tax=Ferviditalea candida TaxID=3108399 RepID=A0ABU5ZDX3_9BACL|nr:deoxyribose-phosphate aldolase [Paenibacillaceae bacterium T2]